jgi:hypothetical protein
MEEPFLNLVPKQGWLRDYVNFTIGSEAPGAFHFMVGAAILGATLGRKVWFNKGYYRIYPTLQILIVAPTGKCRKSSSISIGIKTLQEFSKFPNREVNIISDKVTPEALVTSLDYRPEVKIDVERGAVTSESKDAVAVIVASELAVMLGKQKYNEGIIALFTQLFDSPEEFTTRTKNAGNVVLKNVAITFVGASTPDWLISAIPQDAFGGGFMSRILFVVQEDTPRCFPIPKALDPNAQGKLVQGLLDIQPSGPVQVEMTGAAYQWYILWYTAQKKNIPEDSKMAGYHERKPDHMVRLALLLTVSEGRKEIEVDDLITANKILTHLEKEMLVTFKWLGMRPVGADQERIIRTLRSMGGEAERPDLLRKMIFYMNAHQFGLAMDTLLQSKVVREDQNRKYFLREG